MSEPIVVALDEQEMPIDLDRWTALARDALLHEGVDEGELNLLFVNRQEMSELNRLHMGRTGPTDVLSFPIDAPDGAELGARLLGDVVVCPEYAEAQASSPSSGRDHDGTIDDEIALLVVHGVLHVLGHDHAEPDQARTMQARERVLLDAYHRS